MRGAVRVRIGGHTFPVAVGQTGEGAGLTAVFRRVDKSCPAPCRTRCRRRTRRRKLLRHIQIAFRRSAPSSAYRLFPFLPTAASPSMERAAGCLKGSAPNAINMIPRPSVVSHCGCRTGQLTRSPSSSTRLAATRQLVPGQQTRNANRSHSAEPFARTSRPDHHAPHGRRRPPIRHHA